MPPRPRRLRRRHLPMDLPIIRSWSEEETRVMGRAVMPEGGVRPPPGGVTPAGGVAAAAADFPGWIASDAMNPSLSLDPCVTNYNIQIPKGNSFDFFVRGSPRERPALRGP